MHYLNNVSSKINVELSTFILLMNRYLILFALLIVSCETDLPLEYNVNSNVVVVNSLLNPDSIYSVSVSRSGAYPDNSGYEIINNAVVEIYQNNEFVGQAEYDQSLSRYNFNAFPETGSTIRVLVKLSDKEIYAETTIPTRPDLSGCYQEFSSTDFPFTGKAFISLDFNSDFAQPLWIGLFSDSFARDEITFKVDSSKIIRSLFPSIYSTTFLWDRFNFINDQGIPSYEYYLRTIPELVSERTTADLFSFETNYFFRYSELQELDESLGLYVLAMNASDEYDLYLKSTLINFLNNNQFNDTPNPFAEQVTTYTNVINGAGVVAGYSQQIIPVHENECL